MLKRLIPSIVLQIAVCVFTLTCWAGDAVFSITGQVKHPLNLKTSDLNKFQAVSVRVNNISKTGDYRGVFSIQGVPLRSLLEVCGLQKEESVFPKPVDLAILVRDSAGKQVVLSWGEVFYKNPAEVTLAFSATPVMPHHGASPEQAVHLNRKISFPKLVVSSDYYADRSLEGIVNIEVINMKASGSFKKTSELFSPEFKVCGEVKKTLAVKNLSSYPRMEIPATVVGEGRGFEGVENYQGVSLVELLAKVGVEPDLNTVFVATAQDGYRSLISYGELFLSPRGKRIIVADGEQGKALKKGGKFILVLPDDLSADRQVKALVKIEVLSLKNKAKLYIIGLGPGDTNLITPEAFSYIGKTDMLVCPEDIRRRFAPYLGGKEVLFDPMEMINRHRFVNANPDLSADGIDKILDAERSGAVRKIQDALNAGKSVAYLDWGDPLVFGGSRWIWDYFSENQIKMVPSISAFNVSNAIIARDVTCKGSVILTAPKGMKDNESMLKSAAENGDTLAVFMGLRELKNLMPLLNKYYKDSTPIVIVYNAGISRSEHLIRSTLKDVLSKTDNEQEKHLGMIYIGTCLATNGVR